MFFLLWSCLTTPTVIISPGPQVQRWGSETGFSDQMAQLDFFFFFAVGVYSLVFWFQGSLLKRLQDGVAGSNSHCRGRHNPRRPLHRAVSWGSQPSLSLQVPLPDSGVEEKVRLQRGPCLRHLREAAANLLQLHPAAKFVPSGSSGESPCQRSPCSLWWTHIVVGPSQSPAFLQQG